MDLVLGFLDNLILDDLYPKNQEIFERDHLVRQSLSLFSIMLGGAALLYFSLSSINYLIFWVLFKEKFNPSSQPQPKEGQVWREIKCALYSMPIMSVLTTPIMVLEVRGYSKLYYEETNWNYFFLSIVLFIMFTDTCIYWIHRWEHDIPWLYKNIHKPHHAWFVPTPFAALAFHPVDGFLQSLPYHLFTFILPLQKVLYLCLFVSVQIWTISIHDGVDGRPFGIINGTAHHQIHHSKFLYNHGQFFTFWDRVGGTYLDPYDIPQKKNDFSAPSPKKGPSKEKHH